MEVGEIALVSNISDEVVNQAFLHLPYDMRMGKLGNPSWLENASPNTFATNISPPKELFSNDLTAYYAGYMKSPPNCAAGFRTAGVCLLCDPSRNSPRGGEGVIKADRAVSETCIKQVAPSPSNNVYLYL